MATIAATVTQTGNPNASKTYTLADADMDKAIAAYQQGANTAINGTANRNQVLNYMFDLLIKSAIQTAVQSDQTVPASTPPPITIS
jgi:hypothetical protein